MTDFGAALREARQRRGLSLRDIAATTKVSIIALEALERNEPARMPGGIFARAIVRSYAVEVGLDPDATVREFVARFALDPPPSELPPEQTEASAAETLMRSRAAGLVLKILVAGLLVAVLILLLTRAANRHDESGLAAPDDRNGRAGSTAPAARVCLTAGSTEDHSRRGGPGVRPGADVRGAAGEG
jgi:cytoskeletal protein RodZ